METERKNWSVVLLNAGASKLSVIKVIRERTDYGLKEAKDIVDNPPQTVVNNLSQWEALRWKDELASAGAQVKITSDDSNIQPNSSSITNNFSVSEDERREQQHRVAKKSAEIEERQSSGCFIFFLCFLAVAAIFGSAGIGGGFALFLTVILFIFVLVVRDKDKQQQLDVVRNNVKKEQEEKRDVMKQVFDRATTYGFSVSSKVTDPNNLYCIATDNEAKKILVKSTKQPEYTIYDFTDLVDFELSQDGVSTISSRAGDALVGGVLFGATGAVIGAAKSKDIQEFCSSLYIALTFKNSTAFRVQIPFITNKISKSSSEYSDAVDRAKEMISLLQLIKNSNETEQRVNSAVQTNSTSINTASMDAIKQYKELLDLGIISQEEFDLKRKELLNI